MGGGVTFIVVAAKPFPRCVLLITNGHSNLARVFIIVHHILISVLPGYLVSENNMEEKMLLLTPPPKP